MTTYQRWMEKFNAGGHETFEEFICNEIDKLLFTYLDEGSDGVDMIIVDEAQRLGGAPAAVVGDEEVPPTDPNAGSPPDA